MPDIVNLLRPGQSNALMDYVIKATGGKRGLSIQDIASTAAASVADTAPQQYVDRGIEGALAGLPETKVPQPGFPPAPLSAAQAGPLQGSPFPPQQQQQQAQGNTGFFGRMAQGLRSPDFGNRLMEFFAGNSSTPNIALGLGRATENMRQGNQQRRLINKNAELLTSQMGFSPDDANTVASNPALFNRVISMKYAGQDPLKVLQEEKLRLQINALEHPELAPDNFSLNTEYGVDKNGNPVLLQVSNKGTSIATALPEGVSLTRPPMKISTGTHEVLIDPVTRQEVGIIRKENEQAAFEKAFGTKSGNAEAEKIINEPLKRQQLADRAYVAQSGLSTLQNMRELYEKGRERSGVLGGIGDYLDPAAKKDAEAYINSLQSIIANDMLAQAKKNSPNGASGFGNLSNREYMGLADKIAGLRYGMSAKAIEKSLDEIEKYLNKAVQEGRLQQPSTGQLKTKTGFTWSID